MHCAICSRAIALLEKAVDEGFVRVPIHKIVVHDYRDVSDKVELDLGLKHESPQLIILKEDQVLYIANHNDINIQDVLEYLGQ